MVSFAGLRVIGRAGEIEVLRADEFRWRNGGPEYDDGRMTDL
jgi:hypothetical protein